MINAKKAKKLRKLVGVKSDSTSSYTPHVAGTVTLEKQSPRSVNQRIKRRGLLTPVLKAGSVK